jgi:predicted transcriptional regulator
MIASELIVDILPPIKPSESCGKAIKWMNEFKISHLPVVNKNEFIGIISEEMLYDINNEDISIADSGCQLLNVFVPSDHHIFEAMKLMSDNNLSIMPVIDKQDNYIGATTLAHIMDLTTNTTSVKEPGGVIVLEVNSRDYSLAQIAQIVESNNARILSSYITSSPDSNKMEITIKINKQDLSRIIQTFNRYEYDIVESYQENSEDEEELKSRYDHLMRFLDL